MHLRPRLAAVTAAVLAVTGLAILTATTTPAPASAAPAQITEGHLVWGVKGSWRRYIGGYDPATGAGSSADDGAVVDSYEETPDGLMVPVAWRFPVESGSFDPETGATTLDLAGSLHFRAWLGQVSPGKWALDTEFSDLRIVVTEGEQVLRGTHTGYTREDPGGELHVDDDVVLARFDVAAAQTTFGPPTTTYAAIPTTAGPGLSIYGEGTTLDNTSFTYTGAGALPDLAERFDAPGVPVLETAASYSTGRSASAVDLRRLLVSGDGERLFAFTRYGQGPLTVTALDAATMTPVGTPYTHTFRSTDPQLRFTIDPATDTLFFLDTHVGEPVPGSAGGLGVEHVVRSLRFDGTTFTAGTVGRLDDSTTRQAAGQTIVSSIYTSGLVWNPVADELVIGQRLDTRPDVHTSDEIHRFVPDAGGWAHTSVPFRMPSSGGEWGNATTDIASPLSSVGYANDNLAVLGDGSYVLATGQAPAIRQDDDGVDHYMGALHLRLDDDGAVVSEIAGTVLPAAFFGTLYNGYTQARSLADGRVVLHGDGASLEDLAPVSVGADGVAVKGAAVVGEDMYAPYETSVLGTSVADDPLTGGLWVVNAYDPDAEPLHWYDGTTDAAGYPVRRFADYLFGNFEIHTLADGSVVVPMTDYDVDGQPVGWLRLTNRGLAPRLTEQPTSVEATIPAATTSTPVSFSVALDDTVDGAVQWQRKRDGESGFTDLAGATAATLTLDAVPTDDGSTYRAVVTNDAGRIASDEVSLDLAYAPVVVQQPFDAKVEPGGSASFSTLWEASPDATITWQRKVSGFWTTIAGDDDNVTITEGGLTVPEADADMSGTQLRARLVNDVGTTFTRVATLEVAAPPSGPASLSGVRMEWTGSLEMQAAPPFGGSSYFSAGVSDGTETTYRAAAGDVSVVQRAGTTDAPATWATRARHVDADPATQQVVVLDDGTGRLEADGSATVSWRGSFTVNFYGGMVPFTVTDPVLAVGADGSGTLTGDLSGYGATQEDPDDKTPVPPQADVTISTFDDGTFDPDGFEVVPDYAGVAVTVPAGGSPQVRTGEHWGAWPQPFVTFHGATGLTSYWYSSGGAADPLKAGTPVVFGTATLGPVEETPAVAPRVTRQPVPARATASRTATFGVAVAGDDVRYQWQRRLGASWLDLSDETAAELTLAAVTPTDDGARVRVRAWNDAGSVTSRAVGLDVVAARTTTRLTVKGDARRVLVARVAAPIAKPVRGRLVVRVDGRRVATLKVTGAAPVRYRLPRSTKPGRHRLVVAFTPTSPGWFASSRVARTVRVR